MKRLESWFIKSGSLFTKWDSDEIDRWEKIYAEGKSKFIFQTGLVFGLFLFVGSSLGAYFFQENSQISTEFIKLIGFNFIIVLIASLIFGYWCWWATGHSYRRMLQKKQTTPKTQESSSDKLQ